MVRIQSFDILTLLALITSLNLTGPNQLNRHVHIKFFSTYFVLIYTIVNQNIVPRAIWEKIVALLTLYMKS